MVYELIGIPGETDPELRVDDRDVERCRITTAAMALFDAGRFEEARDQYQRVLDLYPGDGVAFAMLHFAQEARSVTVGP
jgi:tetratricopeptide (TPR) repeat protein